MSIGLFNSAISPSPKTHVVYNIGINNQQIHTKNTLVSLQKSLLSKCSSMGAKLFEPDQNRYRFENGPNSKHCLKCGFCKKLLLYECNSDQLPTFFSFCHHFWVGATAKQQQTHPKVMTEWKKSGQLVRVAFVKK